MRTGQLHGMLRWMLALLAAARPMSAQATIAGIVYDSIAHAPLPRATVQLVAADSNSRAGRAVVADSLGRFVMGEVPSGHYMIGFLHPMLDSLGLEPPVHDLYVIGDRTLTVELGIPSAARLRVAICGGDSAGLLVGTVRDATTRAGIPNATVAADWLELSFTANGRISLAPTRVASTSATGWFAMCGIPRNGTVMLSAAHGGDSTQRVEVEISSDGFLRRELFLGSAAAARTGRLTGVIISAADGTPISAADVSLGRGAQTRSNDHGEWMIDDAPLGTHTLDIRAVGYYPERRAVDVLGEAVTAHVALRTMKAVLDTVKVNARQSSERWRAEFDARRSLGIGHYITAGDVDVRHPLATSSLFTGQAGVDVVTNRQTGERILQMNMLGTNCRPAVYVDGLTLNSLTADDVDAVVKPEEIAGIEIYSGAVTPPQFSAGMAGVPAPRRVQDPRVCGSIVIWTKPTAVAGETSWRQRIVVAAGILGLAALLVTVF